MSSPNIDVHEDMQRQLATGHTEPSHITIVQCRSIRRLGVQCEQQKDSAIVQLLVLQVPVASI